MKHILFILILSFVCISAAAQTDKKLSELTSASTLTGPEYFYLIQGGNSRKVSISSLFNLTSTYIPYSNGSILVGDPDFNFNGTQVGIGVAAGSDRVTILEDGTNSGLKIEHGSSNLFASIEGPDNRDLRIVVMDNDASDAFEIWTNNGGASASRFEFLSTGKFKINTPPTNDNAETSLLVLQSDGEVQTRASSTFQPSDTELTALASTTSAADKVPYYTGSGTATTTTLTSFARTILDDTDAVTARATLGLPIYLAAVNLSSSQIKNCGSSPPTIIAAPGAGKYINIISVTVSYNYVSQVFDFSETPYIGTIGIGGAFTGNYYGTNGTSGTSFLNSETADSNYQLKIATTGGANSITTNQAVALRTATNTDATTGNGDLDVVVYYTIEDVN